MVSFLKSSLIMLPFLSVVLHESGNRNAFLGPWLNDTDLYLAFFVLKITELEDNVIYNVLSSVSNQSLAKVTFMNLPIKSWPHNMNQEPSRLYKQIRRFDPTGNLELGGAHVDHYSTEAVWHMCPYSICYFICRSLEDCATIPKKMLQKIYWQNFCSTNDLLQCLSKLDWVCKD